MFSFLLKKCNSYDNYICDECLPGYEVNSLTGYCIKKTELIPTITWKDIYRLKLNHNKYVNNRYVTGPYLRIRGITSSQINTRHGFLIYLIFELKHSLRNLEEKETLKIPAICEVLKEVDKTYNDANMVEYECIGNMTKITEVNLTNYKLENIEEGNNENILKNSNLNELVSEIKSEIKDLENLENVEESKFTLEDLVNIVIFEMNKKIENIEANDLKFNFTIEGKLNKNITEKELILQKDFELAEVDSKANCTFKASNDKSANLICYLNVEKYKNIPKFSFKTSQIYSDDKEIYLPAFNDIILINNKVVEVNDNDKDNKKEEDDEKTKDTTTNDKSKESDNNKKVIIISVCIVGVFVVAILVGVAIFFLRKNHKSEDEDISFDNINEDQIRKYIQTYNTNLNEGTTSNRINKSRKK